MTGDTISTNTSRKSSIGIFSIESVGDDTEENTCRKSNAGRFSRISLDNDTEEEILQGTIKPNISFLHLSVLLKWHFLQYFVTIFLSLSM